MRYVVKQADGKSLMDGKFTRIFETEESASEWARAICGRIVPMNPPYPEFCRDKDRCSGLGSCPRDPCCAD